MVTPMTRLVPPVFRHGRRFAGDRKGVSAVEFALILPLMLALYFGGIELGDALTIKRKVTRVTSSLSDLVTQSTTISDGCFRGAGISLACDLRVLSETAVLGFPEISLGFTVTSGAGYLLPKMLGPGRAKEMALLGHRIDVAETKALGLANGVGQGVTRTLTGLGEIITFWTPKVNDQYIHFAKDCPLDTTK